MKNTIKGLEAIKNDIQGLRGTEVSVFGQSQVLASEVNEITIDILDVIEVLKPYEVDIIEVVKPCEHCDGENEECEYCYGEGYIVEDMNASEAIEYMECELGDLTEINHDNSYNWSAPISNNFDFRTLKDSNNDKIYVEFKVHRYGDVRCNYTETAILEFNYQDEFLQVISECNKYLNVDGYECNIEIFQYGIEVYTERVEYISTVYPCNIEELKEELSNLE